MRRVLSLVFATCFVLVAVLAFGRVVAGQTAAKGTTDTAWKCGAPQSVSTLPVPGQAERAFTIYTVKCTATRGQVNGIRQKEGVATEFADVTGNSTKGHGVFLETLENGDTFISTYEFTATSSNKIAQSGSNTWKLSAGTGKMAGISGNGTCKSKGNPDGSIDVTCTGTYAIGK